jgi:GNAT superfamily N-acetyltransferase
VSLFADLDLSQRLERAEGVSARLFVEARREVSPERESEWIQAGGVCACFDGPDSPVTQTFGLGLFEPVTGQALSQLEAFFFERQAEVNHEISPLAGVECFRFLADRGYRPVEFTSVMYLPIGTEPASKPEIEVRAATSADYDTWAQVSAQGWSKDAPELKDFVLDLGRVIARKRNSVAWLALLDGKPIATAAQTICEGVSHMAGASTIPEARGRGAQLALLGARLRYAKERGCSLALMGAQPGSASQRNAERQGFRIAYTRQKWHLAKAQKH